MNVPPAEKKRLLQLRGGLRRLPGRGVDHSQLRRYPRLRPMVRRGRAARQYGDELIGQRIVRADRPHDLVASADRQRRASHHLLRPDFEKVRLLHDAPFAQHAIVIQSPERAQHGVGEVDQRRGPSDRPPGKLPLERRIRGGVDGLGELHFQQPIGIGQIQLQRGVVLVERLAQLAHVVVALAGHGVVADRIDPAAVGAAQAAARGVAKSVGRLDVFARVVGRERQVVCVGGIRLNFLPLRPGRFAQRAPAPPRDQQRRQPESETPTTFHAGYQWRHDAHLRDSSSVPRGRSGADASYAGPQP